MHFTFRSCKTRGKISMKVKNSDKESLQNDQWRLRNHIYIVFPIEWLKLCGILVVNKKSKFILMEQINEYITVFVTQFPNDGGHLWRIARFLRVNLVEGAVLNKLFFLNQLLHSLIAVTIFFQIVLNVADLLPVESMYIDLQ